jgi:H+/Cl- antiporter ClcA
MLTNWRFEAVYDLVAKEKAGSVPSGLSFAVFWIIGLAYALTASISVILVEPASGGAGIPEVKMILNGVKMPRITRFKTLICRVFGNIFSVSSGLPGTHFHQVVCKSLLDRALQSQVVQLATRGLW